MVAPRIRYRPAPGRAHGGESGARVEREKSISSQRKHTDMNDADNYTLQDASSTVNLET